MPFVSIGGYPIDVFTKETHGYESEVTQYAVETGSDVTDNVRTLPDKLSLECVVSNTPIGAIASDPTRTGVGNITIGQDAHNRLLAMRNAKLPIEVVTSLGTYTSMMITKYEVNREAKTYHGLVFTCDLERVVIVENKRVTVAVPNMAGKGSLGNVDSDIYRRATLIKGQTIPVVTLVQKSGLAAWTKIYGKPIATAGEIVLVGGLENGATIKRPDQSGYHFAIAGTATNNPDGYLKVGVTDGFAGSGDLVYEALKPRSVKSTAQVVQDKVHEIQMQKTALEFANSHGQHYDSQTGQWKDVNGNPVTHDPNAVENFGKRIRDTPSPGQALGGSK